MENSPIYGGIPLINSFNTQGDPIGVQIEPPIPTSSYENNNYINAHLRTSYLVNDEVSSYTTDGTKFSAQKRELAIQDAVYEIRALFEVTLDENFSNFFPNAYIHTLYNISKRGMYYVTEDALHSSKITKIKSANVVEVSNNHITKVIKKLYYEVPNKFFDKLQSLSPTISESIYTVFGDRIAFYMKDVNINNSLQVISILDTYGDGNKHFAGTLVPPVSHLAAYYLLTSINRLNEATVMRQIAYSLLQNVASLYGKNLPEMPVGNVNEQT